MNEVTQPTPPRSRKIVLSLVALVTFMGVMAWVAVPFYNWFCRVTGYGGTTQTAQAGAAPEILDQIVTVRFDASLDRGMPWQFHPMQHKMDVNIGEVGLAFYEAFNPTDRPVAGQASFNVTPFTAGQYFVKIDCFCFTEQVLQPGERVTMPVTFYVDPEITEDLDAKFTNSITLSYTFYEIDLPETEISLGPVAETESIN